MALFNSLLIFDTYVIFASKLSKIIQGILGHFEKDF